MMLTLGSRLSSSEITTPIGAGGRRIVPRRCNRQWWARFRPYAEVSACLVGSSQHHESIVSNVTSGSNGGVLMTGQGNGCRARTPLVLALIFVAASIMPTLAHAQHSTVPSLVGSPTRSRRCFRASR